MRTTTKERQRHYATPLAVADSDFDSKDIENRSLSDLRQARELARARAQALNYVRLPEKKLPAMLWIAHQLGALARKGGVL